MNERKMASMPINHGGLKAHENNKACHWIEDDGEGIWYTDCGYNFEFFNGGPKDNGMKYCCYCGMPVCEGD